MIQRDDQRLGEPGGLDVRCAGPRDVRGERAGEFTYTYDGVTNRLATVTYPNGQTSTYSYLDDESDHRLQTIHHKYPNTEHAVEVRLHLRRGGEHPDVAAAGGLDGGAVGVRLRSGGSADSAVKHATDTPETVLKRLRLRLRSGRATARWSRSTMR